MSYVKHTWQTGEVIDAEKLNHMEDGIAAGGGSGARGADWEAKEGEDGYIENKPFEETYEDIENLPITVWNNLKYENMNNIIHNMIAPEQWAEVTDIPYEDSYMYGTMSMTTEQFKTYWTYMGETLPTQQEIDENYGGSWDNWAKEKINEEMGDFLIWTSTSYTAGQLPDLSKILNPELSLKLNNLDKEEGPISVSVDYEVPIAIDIWGNSQVFGAITNDVLRLTNAGSFMYEMLQLSGITHITDDDFLFMAGSLSEGMMEYNMMVICSKNPLNVNKNTEIVQETFTTKKDDTYAQLQFVESDVEGGIAKVATIAVSQKDNDNGAHLTEVLKITASENVESTYCVINFGGWYEDSECRIFLDGELLKDYKNIRSSSGGQINLSMSQGDHTLIFDMYYDESANDSTSTSFVFLESGDLGEEAKIVPSTAVLTVLELESATASIEKISYDTTLNYKLLNGKKIIIKQLDDKFIQKPDWWFGEKNYLISEPEVAFKNVAAYAFLNEDEDEIEGASILIGESKEELTTTQILDQFNFDYSGLEIDDTSSDYLYSKIVTAENGEASIEVKTLKVTITKTTDGYNYSTIEDTSALYTDILKLQVPSDDSEFFHFGGWTPESSDYEINSDYTKLWGIDLIYGGSTFSSLGYKSPDFERLSYNSYYYGCEEKELGEAEVGTSITKNFFLISLIINSAYKQPKLDGKWVDIDPIPEVNTPIYINSNDQIAIRYSDQPYFGLTNYSCLTTITNIYDGSETSLAVDRSRLCTQIAGDGMENNGSTLKIKATNGLIADSTGVKVNTGDGLTIDTNSKVAVANASQTSIGGIKIVASGDTLYISNDGLDPIR